MKPQPKLGLYSVVVLLIVPITVKLMIPMYAGNFLEALQMPLDPDIELQSNDSTKCESKMQMTLQFKELQKFSCQRNNVSQHIKRIANFFSSKAVFLTCTITPFLFHLCVFFIFAPVIILGLHGLE